MEHAGDADPHAGRSSTRTTTVVVLAAVFMTNLDLWIVNVAFVAMEHDIGGSLAVLSWVLNGYAVTLAALLVAAGQLGDRFGHRQVFLAGLALFTLGSAACAAAPSVGLLVGARVVQAAGAAAQLPTSLALLLAATEPARRLTAARIWSASGALAATTGPVLGGALILASWRWVFLVNLPIGLIIYALGHRTLARTPAHRREPLPDLIGGALLIVVVSALTGALVQAPTWGWTSQRVLALLGLATVGAALFVWRCRTHPVPLIELALLRRRGFATANAATFLFSVAFAIMLLSNSLWCQDTWHYSPVTTGLALAPGPLLVPIVALASNRLVHRLGPGRVAAIGGLVFTVSQLMRVWLCTAVPAYLHDLLPSVLLGGIRARPQHPGSGRIDRPTRPPLGHRLGGHQLRPPNRLRPWGRGLRHGAHLGQPRHYRYGRRRPARLPGRLGHRRDARVAQRRRQPPPRADLRATEPCGLTWWSPADRGRRGPAARHGRPGSRRLPAPTL